MGELHLAASESLPGLSKVCALKRLRAELAAEKSYVDRFLDEARLAAQLAHANLATVYDVGKAEDSFYMAMEYIVGKDCRRILDRAHEDGLQVPVEVGLYIARELADALAYAHRVRVPGGDVGLIHRDVSPTNVLVSYEGQVKLIDFGLAKHATAAGKTETGVVLGKVAYMAPEQCLGDPVDTRADIYSVGAVLYELLTGKRLREVQDLERLADIVRQPVTELPSSLRAGVPVEVDAVLAKTLAVEWADRYQHAEGLRDDLTAILRQLEPRMSRDVVAAFLRRIFPAEHKSETERAQLASTEAAPQQPESVLPGGGSGRQDRQTQVMAVIDRGALAAGSEEALRATDPQRAADLGRDATQVVENPLAALDDSELEEAEEAKRAAATEGDSAQRASAQKAPLPGAEDEWPAATAEPLRIERDRPTARGGARWLLVVLLAILCLVAGFAVRHLLLPDLGDLGEPEQPRRAERAALVSSSGTAPGAGTTGADRSTAAPRSAAMRARPRRPPPRREPPRPTVAELEQQARQRLRKRIERLAEADLRKLGVRVSDLPALPDLEEHYQKVRRALQADDLAKSVAAIAELRRVLDRRRMSCKRLRRKKYGWSRARLKELRRAAPRKRAERKAFLEKHRYQELRARLREMRKRARSDKLSCAEKSLAYEQLIPDIVQTLEDAGLIKETNQGAKGDKGERGGKGERRRER
jgi:tRNA A-37 threonylcarbamoyl transferase component Bud32